MRTRTIITTIAIAWCGLVSAQTVHTLSLEQAVNLALQNAEELKNLRLDVAIQELNNKEITGTVYPQVSASGQGSYYTNLPLIQFPSSNFPIYEVLQDLGVKDGNGNPVSTSDAYRAAVRRRDAGPDGNSIGEGNGRRRCTARAAGVATAQHQVLFSEGPLRGIPVAMQGGSGEQHVAIG